MAVKLISVKCPDCGATLNIEEGRTQAFCTYCGAKVLINNENEHIYWHIDEAGIKQAETDRMVKLRQLQMEEKENEGRKYLIIVWLAATVILTVLGIIGMITDIEGLGMCLLLAMNVGGWGALGIFGKKKKRTHVVGANEAIISSAMASHADKNFNSVVALFRSAGFQNVTAVPLNDLNIFTQGKNGKVDDVTIDGDSDFDEGDVFAKTAHVTITYHSTK